MDFLHGFFKPDIEELHARRDVQGLMIALRFKDPAVRRAAAEALGKIGDSCAVNSLLKALKDDNQNVRMETVSALGEIGHPSSVQALIELLDHKDNQLVHKTAEALIKMCASSIEPLIAALDDTTNRPKTCCRLIGVLGKIRDIRAVEPLIAALKHPNRDVRLVSAEALGEIGDPNAVESIIEALNREDAFSCLKTGEALRKIGDPRAVVLLVRALEDGDCDVAWRAACALGKIGDPHAVDPLIRAIDQGDAFLCLKAAEALGEIGDPRAVEPLLAVYRNSKDHAVRDRANDALKKCGYQGSPASTDELDELKKLLDHSLDKEIFVRAAESLGFRVLGDEPSGLPMESHTGRLMLTVLASIHPTDIARIVYRSKGTDRFITLVDECRRKY